MISRIYKIDDEVVFYSPVLGDRRTDLFVKLTNGVSIAHDIEGNVLSCDEAVQGLSVICDRQIGDTLAERVLSNINLSSILIATVRSELLQYPNGEVLFGKLTSVIIMLQVGMFTTASQALLAVVPDEIITTERLQKWSNMLTVSDALTS
jgi:hypothetical protein